MPVPPAGYQKNLAIVVTTHNLAPGALADRIITLEDGRILEEKINPRV